MVDNTLKKEPLPVDFFFNEKVLKSQQVEVPVLKKIRPNGKINKNDIVGYEYLDKYLLNNKEGFVTIVLDDNMEGENILPSDRVVVVRDTKVNPRQISMVFIENEITLTRAERHNDFYILSFSNPKKGAMVLPLDQVKIIGKVVEVRRQLVKA